MKSGSSSGSLGDNSGSTVSSLSSSPVPQSFDDQLIAEIERLNLSSSKDPVKYFSGFDAMADLVKKRPDLIDNDDLFHLVFKYTKAYFENTKDRICVEHLKAVLNSGNQYSARNLELVFLWALAHEMNDVLECLLLQKICFIRDFAPITFKIFISKQKFEKYLEYLLFSSWPSANDTEMKAIFNELFEYTARKGTPGMLAVFLARCDYLNNQAAVMRALELAIDKPNIPNVVYLRNNKHIDASAREKVTAKILQLRDVEMLDALQRDEAGSQFCEKVIFRAAQMYNAGSLHVDDAAIILGMVEAYVAIVGGVHQLEPGKRREYFINLGLELIGLCRQISLKAKEEALKAQGVNPELLSILDNPMDPRHIGKDSLLNEILHEPRRKAVSESTPDAQAPSDKEEEGKVFIPMRKASLMRLQRAALNEVGSQAQHANETKDPTPSRGYGSPPPY